MGEEPDEIEGAGQGGACVSGHEAEVRLRESALSRAEEERAPTVCHLRSGQPVCEPQKAAAFGGVTSRTCRVHGREELVQTRSS